MATEVINKSIKLSTIDIKEMIHENVADSLWEMIFFENVDVVNAADVVDFTVTINFVASHNEFYFNCHGEAVVETPAEEEPSEEVMI